VIVVIGAALTNSQIGHRLVVLSGRSEYWRPADESPSGESVRIGPGKDGGTQTVNNDSFFYAFFGGLALIGLVAILGGFLHARRERLLTHTERMKALELGRAMPDDPATARIKAAYTPPVSSKPSNSEALAGKCHSTVLWVAFSGFGAAVGAVQAGGIAVAIAIAASVGAIGVTGIICGTILASRPPLATAPAYSSKPTVEEDEYDVVSSRG
jgi:hypothetical protein